MYAMFITICALVILLGYEIRYRELADEVTKFKTIVWRMNEDVARLKEEIKMKKDVYDEYKKT